MSGALECALPVRRLRGFVGLASFGLFFVYLLSGSYLSEKPRLESRSRVGRHLLGYQEEVNNSSDSCSGLYSNGHPVDTATAHVSETHGGRCLEAFQATYIT